jgi:hypothetical protein
LIFIGDNEEVNLRGNVSYQREYIF